MIYEIRFYTATSGRVADIVSRFEKQLPPLLVRHGINQMGRWIATSGAKSPCFIYAMSYADLASREAQWAAFYADDEWWRVRAQTNDGEEMIERYDLLFVRESPIADRLIARESKVTGKVHELVVAEIAIGRGSDANEFFGKILFPRIQRAGGSIYLIGDVIAGTRLPKLTWMISWPDAETQIREQLAIDVDPLLAQTYKKQRAEFGRTIVGRFDRWILRPIAAQS